MRGERDQQFRLLGLKFGSSPHARGTPDVHLNQMLAHRFIPACAGNADEIRSAVHFQSVHPRMRGERLWNQHRTGISTGSSPHARGTHRLRLVGQGGKRFIPACAGNAESAARSSWAAPVHPRMRGERAPVAGRRDPAGGSSPHARGTRQDSRGLLLAFRFIPACAGNARSSRTGVFCPPVHPRMRGERTSNKLLIYRRKSEPSDSTKHSGC